MWTTRCCEFSRSRVFVVVCVKDCSQSLSRGTGRGGGGGRASRAYLLLVRWAGSKLSERKGVHAPRVRATKSLTCVPRLSRSFSVLALFSMFRDDATRGQRWINTCVSKLSVIFRRADTLHSSIADGGFGRYLLAQTVHNSTCSQDLRTCLWCRVR